MTAGNALKSTAEMLSDIIGHVGSVICNEADLARTEIAENLKRVGASLVAMGLALALVMTGFNLLATWLVGVGLAWLFLGKDRKRADSPGDSHSGQTFAGNRARPMTPLRDDSLPADRLNEGDRAVSQSFPLLRWVTGKPPDR